MIFQAFIQNVNPSFFTTIINRFNEGGPVYMYTLFVLLIVCITLLIKAFLKGDPNGKTQKLVSSISLFALVWGFLGLMIGFISAFDALEASNGDIHPAVLAGGLKIGLLSPSFGMFVFLVARLGIIALIIKKK